MHRAPSGKAVSWPHSMEINAKALICSRLMIRALGLILGEELSFSDWQPELFITQPESQSSALQVTNQSQALPVGKEGKQVWNGQQQLAKIKPNFCLSPPASYPPWSSSTRISGQYWRQFSRGMKITAIPGITQTLQGHKPLSQQQETHTQKKREIQTNHNKAVKKTRGRQGSRRTSLLLVFLLLLSEEAWRMNITASAAAGRGHEHGHSCSSTSWPAVLCLSTDCNICTLHSKS